MKVEVFLEHNHLGFNWMEYSATPQDNPFRIHNLGLSHTHAQTHKQTRNVSYYDIRQATSCYSFPNRKKLCWLHSLLSQPVTCTCHVTAYLSLKGIPWREKMFFSWICSRSKTWESHDQRHLIILELQHWFNPSERNMFLFVCVDRKSVV